MADFHRRAWLEIDLDRLRRNTEFVGRQLSDGCAVMAVVKADAYGQGAAMLGPALERCGVRHFGVATAQEGEALRAAGVAGEILVLAYTGAEQVEGLIRQKLTQAVVGKQHAFALNEAAKLAGGRLKVQIKLDTGMTRTGFDCVTEAQLDEAAAAYSLDHLEVTGTFSHFSSSDDGREGADDYTRMQLARFLAALDGLTARGAAVGERHICNSGGTQKYPQAHLDLVRCGAVLSGYNTAVGLEPWPLEPITDWKTSVSCVREIGPGTPISYGRTFVAPHVMRVATLSVGYADGYPRALSNKGRVLLHGRWANLLGSVCMDQMMVDVTGIDGVEEGDVATILGRDGLLVQTADDLAAQAKTCTHEILSRFGSRLQRVYRENGAIVAIR